MVDAIKNAVNRLELAKGRAPEARPVNSDRSAAAAITSVDDVKVSEAASPKKHMQLAETPPVDNEAVSRLKTLSSAENTRLMWILSLKHLWMLIEI